MAIVKPEHMDFSNKKFSMIITGSPGVGKTTLALSAPAPILIDFDQGISRVKAQHRKDTIISATYEEVLNDMQSPEMKDYETIVIDTGGNLITYLQDWAIRRNPANCKKSGGVSQQGYGAVKTEFARFTNHLKYTLQKNVIYIFHTVEEKDKEGGTVQRLMCEGSARNIVWQPCDFGCFVYISGNERIAGFTPTEQYFAKGCHGISGLKKVPELTVDVPNLCVSNWFEGAKQNLLAETEFQAEVLALYNETIDKAKKIIDGMTDEETATSAINEIASLEHYSTSGKEVRHMFTVKINALGLKYDKEAGAYVRAS